MHTVSYRKSVLVVVHFFLQNQEKDSQQFSEKDTKIFELLSVAMKTIRTWIGQTLRGKLLQHYTLNAHLTSEIEVRKY